MDSSIKEMVQKIYLEVIVVTNSRVYNPKIVFDYVSMVNAIVVGIKVNLYLNNHDKQNVVVAYVFIVHYLELKLRTYVWDENHLDL